MTDQTRRQIQRLLQDPNWQGIETFLNDFLMRNFATDSAKRMTEFDTMWYLAEREGGKRILLQFMRELEDEARKVDTL